MKVLKSLGHYLLRSLFLSAVVSLTINVVAEDVVKFNSDALQETLKNYHEEDYRAQNMGRSSAGQLADAKVRGLMGNAENTKEMYRVAGEIFRQMASDSGGDIKKLMALVKQRNQDPITFYNSLTPEQKAMIQNLKKRAEANQIISPE